MPTERERRFPSAAASIDRRPVDRRSNEIEPMQVVVDSSSSSSLFYFYYEINSSARVETLLEESASAGAFELPAAHRDPF